MKELDLASLEQQARDLYYSLDDINEYGRLLKQGLFSGCDHKSIAKCDEFFRKTYKETLLKIEANTWYQTEKAAMEKINMDSIMADSEGEYDPKYKVTLHDVFRKVIK